MSGAWDLLQREAQLGGAGPREPLVQRPIGEDGDEHRAAGSEVRVARPQPGHDVRVELRDPREVDDHRHATWPERVEPGVERVGLRRADRSPDDEPGSVVILDERPALGYQDAGSRVWGSAG